METSLPRHNKRSRAWQASVALLLWAISAVVSAGTQDALAPTGAQAAHIDALWRVSLWTCTLFGALVVIALVIALWRAPRSTQLTPAGAPDTGTEKWSMRVISMALAVSIVGLLGLTVASVATDRALAGLSSENPLNIKITAHNWWWEISYEDAEASRTFTTANELHIPVGRPVFAKLESSDVIHSFWVPNLHGKRDLIPGKTSTIKFQADRPGSFRGQCAEFCGYQHAHMAFWVIAEAPADYEIWADQQRGSAKLADDAQKRRGETVFLSSTCPMCHSIQGTSANGKMAPDLTHLASRAHLAAGTLPNRAGELAAWIVDPQRFKPGANMPGSSFSPDDLQALVAYLQSLT